MHQLEHVSLPSRYYIAIEIYFQPVELEQINGCQNGWGEGITEMYMDGDVIGTADSNK